MSEGIDRDDEEIAAKGRITRVESEDSTPQPGQWFWVTYEDSWDSKKKKRTELMCVMRLGSNYVKFECPQSNRDNEFTIRVHFDEFANDCKRELNPEAFISRKIETHRQNVVRLVEEVRQITERIGVSREKLGIEGGMDTQALVLASSKQPLKDYKAALVKAKDKQLPALFKEIDNENKAQVRWMRATTLPLCATIGKLEPIVKAIKARIFNVELYAGLVEEVVEVRKGDAAEQHERVRLFQRRHYMDEESLLAYETGGMDYNKIGDFDAWIKRDENFVRVLPFPRCIVAFRVRREVKERDAEDYGGGLGAYIAISHEMQQDKRTFLYMRNGERLYRLSTEIEFGYKLFPDFDAKDLGGGGTMWAKRESVRDLDDNRLEWHVVTEAGLEGLKQEDSDDQLEYDRRWERDKKIAEDKGEKFKEKKGCFPFYSSSMRRVHGFFRVTKDSVYYDDIMKQVEGQVQQHNRLAIVLQGLLDRSPVFHPHPKWELWTPDGFERAVELVYDQDRALSAGAEPDFEAYVAKLNETLTANSVTFGQDDFWQRLEAKKENGRYKRGGSTYHTHFAPHGDPGPGDLARVVRVGKRGAYFTWRREVRNPWRRSRYDRVSEDTTYGRKACVPKEKLFNVDAYKPGDFRQFYADPRTRAKYLRWAPALLMAEEYHAGNRVLDENGKWYDTGENRKKTRRRR